MPENMDALLRVVAVEARQDELSRRVDRFEVSVKDTMERVEQTVNDVAVDVRNLAVAQGAFRAAHEAAEQSTLERAMRFMLPHISVASGGGFLGWLLGSGAHR